MFTTCGKPKLKDLSFNHLRKLGEHIHTGLRPLVFDGGFVGFNDELESEVNSNAETYSRRRSEAGSREGRREQGRSRAPSQAEPFSSKSIEEVHGIGFRFLSQHYEALSFEDRNGLWVAVKTKPLGFSGPQAHLFIGFPSDLAISPRAWAFNHIGPRTSLFPLKHTNFPDASICAFTKESGAWTPQDGMLPLVDHLSLWVAKSWHRSVLGWWPGSQVGACAFYRRREFTAKEWCGCDSGKPYGVCHQFLDNQVPEKIARAQFKRMFAGEYENRCAPASILETARARWKSIPDMATVFSVRRSPDEPQLF